MHISTTVAYIIDVFLAELPIAVSYLLQKIAHHKIEEKNKKQMSSVRVYCSCTWILGFSLSVFGGTVGVLVLPYCDLVLLSTTVGMSIIMSNLLAMYFLKEKIIWRYDIPAFFLVVAGCTSIMLVSEQDDQKLDRAAVLRLLKTPQAIVFFALTLVVLVVSLVTFNRLGPGMKRFENDLHLWINNQRNPRTSSNATISTEETDLQELPVRKLIQLIRAIPMEFFEEISPREKSLRKFCKVPMVLILTAGTLIVGGDLTLFKFAQAMLGDDTFAQTWFLVIPFVIAGAGMAFYSLHLLNLCEKIFDQTDVVPTYYALNLLTQILSGLILLNEVSLYSA